MKGLRRTAGLPPGQRELSHFPRFGVHFSQPAPPVADCNVVHIGGPAVTRPLDLTLSDLATAPRHALSADFHCVAGWTFRGLHWEGIPFRGLYESVILPRGELQAAVTHVRFSGADGFSSVLTLEDALRDDVLLADQLDGAPLTTDHGAPLRLVSPSQYGYKNTKHVVSIELHHEEPTELHVRALRRLLLALVRPHARARVWQEERRRHLPPWMVRLPYRSLIRLFVWLGKKGSSAS